ncbi:uncharacterized protein LOC144647995 [Oculina patagonica]
MSKQNKYVVVDWGSWGIEVQSSSKIIVADPNVKEGDDCSLQGTDPATKRPMLFHGHILAVFGSKKEADKKVNELVRPQIKEKEPAIDAPRPRREPKPTKKKLAELENGQDDCQEPKRKHAKKWSGQARSEGRDSEQQKGEKAGKEQEAPQKKTAAKKKKADPNDPKDDSEIIAVANLQRVQNLLERRQNKDADYVHPSEVVVVDEVSEEKETDKLQDAGTANAPTLTPTSRSTFSSPFSTSTPSHSYGRPYKSPVSRGHSSVSTPTQFMPSDKASVPVLSSPDALQQKPQQEFSISQSLSHCSDYNVSDLDLAMDCSFSSTNLHQLQSAHAHMVPRDGSWQGMSPLQGVSNLCTNCQPVLESLSRRLSVLEADVEKLRRKQRKHGKDTSGNEVVQKKLKMKKNNYRGGISQHNRRPS